MSIPDFKLRLLNTTRSFFEIYFLFGCFIFITGWAPEVLLTQKLIQTKPFLHRIYVSGIFSTSFIGAIFLWRRSSNTLPFSPLQRLGMNLGAKPKRLLWIIFILSAVSGTISSWTLHYVFHTGFDMAIFTQAIWNTTQGNWLYSSIKGGICLLGDHFSPILFLFALPYAIWPDPKCLLLLQACLASSCVFPIYRIAEKRLNRSSLALIFPLAFALYLPLRNAVRFDFHPEIVTLPLWFWAFERLLHEKWKMVSFLLLLGLLSKENAAGLTFAFGTWALIHQKLKFGISWMLFSLAYLWITTNFLIPCFSHQPYFYWSGNFGAWKNQGVSAVLAHTFSPGSFIYLAKIFLPVACLSIFSPGGALLTIPTLIQNLLSRNEMTRSIFFQYTAFLIPGVFISSIEGALKLTCRKPFVYQTNVIYLVLFCSILLAGVSDLYPLHHELFNQGSQIKELHGLIASSPIPPQASVRTHEFLAAHFANRRELYIYENTNPAEGASQSALQADYIVLGILFLRGEGLTAITNLKMQGYKIILESPAGFVLKRGQ